MVSRIIRGFTLLEMMIVVAIIAILATLTLPMYLSSVAREQIQESLALVAQLKPQAERYQRVNGTLPLSNQELGIPEPEKLLGNYVESIELEDGAFHIAFGNKAANVLRGKFLTVRAITVVGSPASPMSWLCGYSAVPMGMEAAGNNLTSVQPQGLLPVSCRALGAQ